MELHDIDSYNEPATTKAFLPAKTIAPEISIASIEQSGRDSALKNSMVVEILAPLASEYEFRLNKKR